MRYIIFFTYSRNIIYNKYNDDGNSNIIYNIQKSFIFCSLFITESNETNIISGHHLFDNLYDHRVTYINNINIYNISYRHEII